MTTTYPPRATPTGRTPQHAVSTPLQAVKPPYLMAGCVSLGALILYILTLAPTTQFWDTSEYITAAYTLGIPHPPGNPLFVLIAHVFGLLPVAAGYAARINLFAAVTSAVSAGCWFLVAERWLRSFVPALWPRRLTALAGALVSATLFTVWNQSVVNEKVYTLSLLSIALILWLIVRWDDQPAGEAHDHHLLLIIYLLALTATNHMMGVLVGPVVLVLLFPPLKKNRPASDQEQKIEWSQFLVFAGVWALLLSLGLESWQPIAAAGVLFAAALVYAFSAGNVSFAVAALLVTIVGVSVYTFLPIRAAFHPPINEGEPTNWQALWAVLTRQQYGKPSIFDNPTQAPGFGNTGHTAALYWAQLVNYAQYFSWQFAHDWPGRVERVLAVVIPLIGNRHAASRKNERLARDFAYDLLQSVEPYGVLVTAGDNDTFPLWYAQEVEGIRQDVTIVNLSLANTDWYTRQLQNRPLVPFDTTNAPALYRGRPWAMPTGKLLSFSDQQLNALEQFYMLESKRDVKLGSGADTIRVTLDPQMLGRPYVERADVIVLQVIKDQLGKRPIYFSRTVGLYADQFGLTGHLEGHGFARALRPKELALSDSIKAVQSLGYVNVPRTTRLLFDVYHADEAARERPLGWLDKPSEGILQLYGLTYYTMANELQGSQSPLSARAQAIAQAIFRNTETTLQPLPERPVR